jgi:multidrug transporter EmrE-like cation transporter
MILSYVSLFLAVLCTAFGQFFYKKFSLTKDKKYYIFTIALFVLVPLFNFIALKHISLDIVYIFTSMTILLVVLLSKYFLNEYIKQRSYNGIILIIIGVMVYAN